MTFVAKNVPAGTAANGFFADNALGNTSSTGVLATPVTKGTYTVEVQVTKNGSAVISDTATVKIVNLDEAATALETATFYNFGTDNTDDSTYNTALVDDDFKMNSTTLVVGEGAKLHKLTGTIAGEKGMTIDGTLVDVKSSNEAVISVGTGGVLTAESAGTATITLTVGNVKKTVNFTVTTKDRVLTKVTTSQPSVIAVIGGDASSVTVSTVDQYGDPFGVASGVVTEVIPQVGGANLATLDVVTTTANKIGKDSMTITAGANAGKGTVYFRDAVTNKTLGSFVLEVTANANVGKKVLEIISSAPDSTDTTLDIAADDVVEYQLSQYNTNNVYVKSLDLNGYQVEVVDGTVATVDFVGSGSPNGTAGLAANEVALGQTGDTSFKITAQKTGTTNIIFKDTASGSQQTLKITVVDNGYSITSVNWKAAPTVDYVGAKVDYTTVLNVTKATTGFDDIVTGVNLNKTTGLKVRLSKDGGTGGVAGLLYVDLNADGVYKAADDAGLGVVTLNPTAASTIGNGPIVSSVAGYTVAANDDATLLFKVLTDLIGVDATTAISGTSVVVKAK